MQILIIDDEKIVSTALVAILKTRNFECETASNGEEGLEKIKKENYDIILCDLQMPGLDGLGFLQKSKTLHLTTPIIMMSAYATSEVAIKAIKLGASDYISKPFDADEIIFTIEKVIERQKLLEENIYLKKEIADKYSFDKIISKSKKIDEIFEVIKKISNYKSSVMLLGESGTGKELVARAIHFNSNRKDKKFVAINCGAIPDNLLESELFGHKAGAFTDAVSDKKGLFEEADGGTLFLDEIAEMPVHLQVKLLRVLQESQIRPVGGNETLDIDVRIISATLKDLESLVSQAKFRDDLYYRLNVVTIHIPPLRERIADIKMLVEHFIQKNQKKLGIKISSISHDALKLLEAYNWPGNIRELENYIERAMILCKSEKIEVSDLPSTVKNHNSQSNSKQDTKDIKQEDFKLLDDFNLKNYVKKHEAELIKAALKKSDGNKTKAAKLLEITTRALMYKIKEYEISS